jgi:hypothetical protein
VIFGARPYPIHKIKRGAIAITGIVWVKSKIGVNDCLIIRLVSMIIANTNAAVTASVSPVRASNKV